MAQNRYVRDYRLVETVDERGRIRTDYEYIGDDYYYLRGPETALKARRTALAVCGVGWAALLGAMLPNSGGMRVLYVSLPLIFTVLALGLLTETLLSAASKTEPFQHRQADRLENRYPAASLAAAVLPGIALLGELVNLLRGVALNGGDGILCLCAAVTAGCGTLAFALRGRFAVRKG